jgi:hypothetical protein
VSKWLRAVRLLNGNHAAMELEMQYLLLIYTNEAEMAGRTASAMASLSAEYTDFTKGIIQAGQFKAGERLKPTSAATTVRVRSGQVAITDEATAIAARIPGAKHGSIEVRPIWPMDP